MATGETCEAKQQPPAASVQPPVRPRITRDTVEFSVKGPVSVNFDEEVFAPGCSVLDIFFATPSSVRELVFRNYYTAWLTLLVRVGTKDQPSAGKPAESDAAWVLGIAHRKLMPVPHLEDGSQDLISIVATESLVEWQNLVAIRLVLRQPSAIWKTFHVEELNVYNDLPRRAHAHVATLHDADASRGAMPHNQKHTSLLALISSQTRVSLNACGRKPTDTQDSSAPGNKDGTAPPNKESSSTVPCYEFFSLPQV